MTRPPVRGWPPIWSVCATQGDVGSRDQGKTFRVLDGPIRTSVPVSPPARDQRCVGAKVAQAKRYGGVTSRDKIAMHVQTRCYIRAASAPTFGSRVTVCEALDLRRRRTGPLNRACERHPRRATRRAATNRDGGAGAAGPTAECGIPPVPPNTRCTSRTAAPAAARCPRVSRRPARSPGRVCRSGGR